MLYKPNLNIKDMVRLNTVIRNEMIYPRINNINAIDSVIISNAIPIGPAGLKLWINEISQLQVKENPAAIALVRSWPKVNSVPNIVKSKIFVKDW